MDDSMKDYEEHQAQIRAMLSQAEDIPFWERACIRPRELAALQLENRRLAQDLTSATQRLETVSTQIQGMNRDLQMVQAMIEQRETEQQETLEAAKQQIARLEMDLLRLLYASEDFGGYAKTAMRVNTPEWMEEYWQRFTRFEHLWDELAEAYPQWKDLQL